MLYTKKLSDKNEPKILFKNLLEINKLLLEKISNGYTTYHKTKQIPPEIKIISSTFIILFIILSLFLTFLPSEIKLAKFPKVETSKDIIQNNIINTNSLGKHESFFMLVFPLLLLLFLLSLVSYKEFYNNKTRSSHIHTIKPKTFKSLSYKSKKT